MTAQRKKTSGDWKNFTFVILCVGLLLLAAPATGICEQGEGKANESKGQKQQSIKQQYQRILQRAEELQAQLQDIQQKALQNNPELKKQKQDFEKFVKKTMDNNLKAQKVDTKRMEEIRKELSEEDLGQEKKQKLQKEFRQHILGYQKARAQTMQNQEVKKKRQNLINRTKTAMIKENPETEQLLEELHSLSQELQRMRQQMPPRSPMKPGN